MRRTLSLLLTLFIAASLAAQESNSGGQASSPVRPAAQQQPDNTNANTLDPEKPAAIDSRQRINIQTVADLNVDSGSSTNSSSAGASGPARTNDSMDWMFPVTKLNRSLPSWFRIGGEYRGRLEGPTGIGFTSTNDFYYLDRLRVNLAVQPKGWLLFYGEVQDARIFFNHHNPNANPYEDKWTLWQAYPQVGSSETGWVDALAGRQVLRFGDERVIGPSDWLNVGRTFNVARVDLHHPGYRVSMFASSVVPGDNTDLHNALPEPVRSLRKLPERRPQG